MKTSHVIFLFFVLATIAAIALICFGSIVYFLAHAIGMNSDQAQIVVWSAYFLGLFLMAVQ